VHDLCASLLEFHTAGWLQRSINTSNVAFFYSKGSAWDPQNFYFLGYSYSRPTDSSAHTEGPLDAEFCSYYYHPHYLRKTQRFRSQYDYYPLGIVLLEISLWRLLVQMRRDQA
jgi:hypothetical protein